MISVRRAILAVEGNVLRNEVFISDEKVLSVMRVVLLSDAVTVGLPKVIRLWKKKKKKGLERKESARPLLMFLPSDQG